MKKILVRMVLATGMAAAFTLGSAVAANADDGADSAGPITPCIDCW